VSQEERLQPKRINVAINEAMLHAIDRMIHGEHVTLTEAVRRLIGYGDHIYRAVKAGDTVIVRTRAGDETQVILHGVDPEEAR